MTQPRGSVERVVMQRADGRPINVLVVDDEAVLAEMVSMALRYEGWNIVTAGDGASAIAAAKADRPDVVVLDVMLPDMSGLDVLGRLREQNPRLPVLFLTAKDALEDRIAGLTAGGDDYVTKPFSIEEVVLRLRALLRRTGVATVDSGALIVVGDLVLDEDSHDVTRGGEPITLTSTEFELLRFMMHNAKRVLSKSQILDRVWDYDFGGRSNIVELYLSYLRKKIDSGRAPMIHTLRGAGYVLKPAPETGAPLVAAGPAAGRSDRAAGRRLHRDRRGDRGGTAPVSGRPTRPAAAGRGAPLGANPRRAAPAHLAPPPPAQAGARAGLPRRPGPTGGHDHRRDQPRHRDRRRLPEHPGPPGDVESQCHRATGCRCHQERAGDPSHRRCRTLPGGGHRCPAR